MGERRPVSEIVMLLLVVTLCSMLLIAVVGGVLLAVLKPVEDLTGLQTWLQNTTSTLVGLLIGIVAGRSSARRHPED